MAVSITKQVRPNAIWQEMYLQVAKGQRVIIAADGIWSPEIRPVSIVWCGPDGIQGRIAGQDYLVPGTNVGALVGKVGDDPHTTVGCYFDFYSPSQGPLFLAMNDKEEYHNQAGVLNVQMILFDL